ncbi:hypothetical protein PG993_007949 [Apiospora rasikravindrae]|uniref:Uncharacterized protein n=1 Tax=Apiospora rasikravindrae TaxID=990691 RepID=A0ABR1SYX9_9PEZI
MFPAVVHAVKDFFKKEPPFHPFFERHIIFPYFVPISPHWAQLETSAFQLLGLETESTYRLFPPAELYPPGFPVLHKGHATNLFFLLVEIIIRALRFHGWWLGSSWAFGDKLLRPVYDRSLGMWLVLLVLRAWLHQACSVAAGIQYHYDGDMETLGWKYVLLSMVC